MAEKKTVGNQIGHVTGVEEPNDYHQEYTLGVIVGIYLLSLLPSALIVVALTYRNNWDAGTALLWFGIGLSITTIVYVSFSLGIVVKLLRTILGFIYKMYVVNRQHNAYIQTLRHEYPQLPMSDIHEITPMRAMLPDLSNNRQVLMDYIRFLYQTDDTGTYVNIYDNGTIKGRVPWSTRERKINEKTAVHWIEVVSYKPGKPVIYYESNTWRLNFESYPNVENVIKAFQKTYVPDTTIDEGEYRDVES